MNLYFLDSSALVKRYLPEVGTRWIRSITNSSSTNRLFISQITSLEITSALVRRHRENHINADILTAILKLISKHEITQYTTILLTSGVETIAQRLLHTYTLRAMDSIQLASALLVYQQTQNPPPQISISFTFVAADKRLLSAAQDEGLTVANPLDF